jgi:hypothetical protein
MKYLIAVGVSVFVLLAVFLYVLYTKPIVQNIDRPECDREVKLVINTDNSQSSSAPELIVVKPLKAED